MGESRRTASALQHQAFVADEVDSSQLFTYRHARTVLSSYADGLAVAAIAHYAPPGFELQLRVTRRGLPQLADRVLPGITTAPSQAVQCNVFIPD